MIVTYLNRSVLSKTKTGILITGYYRDYLC